MRVVAWSCDRFMLQLKSEVKLAEIRYPRHDGWKLVWIFNHISCHTAMAANALDASRMNVKPGGVQPRMHSTVWAGKVQEMNFAPGIPKGMKQVLEERGIRTVRLLADYMKIFWANHEDF